MDKQVLPRKVNYQDALMMELRPITTNQPKKMSRIVIFKHLLKSFMEWLPASSHLMTCARPVLNGEN